MRRIIFAAAIIAAIIVLVVALGIAVHYTHKPAPTLVTTISGAHGTPTQTVTVPKAAVAQAQASELGQHEDLRSENPPKLPAAQKDAATAQQEALAANDQLPIATPDAAPEQRGCATQLVRNYSSRRGVKPRIFVLHYTVSPNRPGWSDVNAVVSLFDRASFQASSNYVIDAEGHCKYIVRESDKAWTQAAANPEAISVEEINSGHESSYAGTAGLAKIALVASDALKRWQIPLQRGLVVGCVVRRAGIVDHHSLGLCGGGHSDIGHYSVDQVIAAVKASRQVVAPKPLAPLYAIVAWKPGGPAAHFRTRSPGKVIASYTARGYTRISVVREPRK